MARDPSQDRVKLRRDQVFIIITKIYSVHSNLISCTYCWKRQSSKHSRQGKPGSFDSNNNPRDRKMCPFIFCAIHYKISPRFFARSSAWSRSTGSRFNDKPALMNSMYVALLYSVTLKEEYIGVGRVLRDFFPFPFFLSECNDFKERNSLRRNQW